MKRIVLLLLALLASVGWTMGQHRTIRGVVTSASDGAPLPMVAVLVEGTTHGVSTGEDGSYSIDVTGPDAVLVFAYTGYETQKVVVADSKEINVALKMATEQIDEVMVVAYGTVKKESFTGSADVISSKKLEKRPVSNVTKTLDGMTTGVLSTSGSGQPGAGSTVVIRGYGSINASTEPLYVVDGIPYGGTISSLNPADIESVTVLKDASAGALYGARGANGVIMITTKKGSMGEECDKMRVNFKGSWGFSNRAIPRFKTLDEKQYLEYFYQTYKTEAMMDGEPKQDLHTEAIARMSTGNNSMLGKSQRRIVKNGKVYVFDPEVDKDIADQSYVDFEFNPFDKPFSELFNPETGEVDPSANLLWHEDWMDVATRKFPFRQEYSLSVSGGAKKTTYMVSFGALWDKGMLVTTDFSRYTGLVGVDTKPKDWLAMGLNANLASTNSNYAYGSDLATSNVWYTAAMMGPIYPVYKHDNAFQKIKNPKTGKYEYDYSEARPNAGGFNSIGDLYDNISFDRFDRVSARSYVNLLDLPDGPLKGLKIAFNLGGDFSLETEKVYFNRNNGNAKLKNGLVEDIFSRHFSFTANQLVSYVRTFADVHTVDFLIGHESYRSNTRELSGYKEQFAADGVYELNAASANDQVAGGLVEYAIESFLSRFNYNYAERYYFSASYRRDGSSRFPKESRWGNFWSVGANWRISEEAFLKDVDWVNNLSFKVSYGVQGNDDLDAGNYPYRSTYNLTWGMGERPGALLSGLENRELTWESNHNFNVGIEGRMWNRFSFGIEWYLRRTVDMLLAYPLPMSTGFLTLSKNVGEMINHGLEISLQADVLQLENGFRWGVAFMGSTVNNKVLKLLPDQDQIIDGGRITKVGYPIHSYYLPKSAGVNPLTGQRYYWGTIRKKSNPKEDSITNVLTSDVKIANNASVILGSRMPKFFGSFSTDLEYFGFDFSALFGYSIGGYTTDHTYRTLVSPTDGYLGKAIHVEALRAWRKPGDKTDIPMATTKQISTLQTDADLISASYLSIKNISLGYTFPNKWMEAIDCQNLRLSFVVENVWLFAQLPGINPQNSLFGGQTYSYAPTRSFTFHLDLTF